MPSRMRAVSTSSSSTRSQKLAASTGAPYRKGFRDSTGSYYSSRCNIGIEGDSGAGSGQPLAPQAVDPVGEQQLRAPFRLRMGGEHVADFGEDRFPLRGWQHGHMADAAEPVEDALGGGR